MIAWSLTFQSNTVLVVLLFLVVPGSAWLFYRRLKGAMSPRRWKVLLGLRLVGIFSLLILIFKPTLGFKSRLVDRSVPVVLADVSRSMQVRDAEGRDRLELVQRLLRENMDLLTQDPPVQLVTFARDAISVSPKTIDQWSPQGEFTDLTAALRSLSNHVPAEAIQAIVVLSDGNHLGSEPPGEAVESIRRPVYFLGVGSVETAAEFPNMTLDLSDPPVKLVARSDNPVTVDLAWQGLGRGSCTLVGTVGGVGIEPREVQLSNPAGKRQTEVDVRPPGVGKTVTRFEVRGSSREALACDNVREFHSLALPEKIRVLMVEGQVRPEYKFLKQYLQSDPAIALAAFVQIRPGKFLVTSHIPNYQPKELPASKAELDQFDLLILGDAGARTFSPQQAGWIRAWIESGKGLLVIPGQDTAELKRTVLADLLPVRLADRITWSDQPFSPQIAPAGKTHPALKNLSEFFPGRARLTGWFSAGRALPVSAVLLEGPRREPVLSVRPAGRGRVGLLATEGTWRWALNPDPNLRDRLYKTFWGQLLRYLANKNLTARQPPVLIVNTDAGAAEAGKPVKVRADWFDGNGLPVTAGKVAVKLIHKNQPVQSVPLALDKDHFSSSVIIRDPGEYELQATAEGTDPPPADSIPVVTYRIDEELRRVSLNKKLLDELANTAGTEKMRPVQNLGAILQDLRQQFAARAEQETNLREVRSFDHRVLWLMLFLAALCTEWVLRFRWRLR